MAEGKGRGREGGLGGKRAVIRTGGGLARKKFGGLSSQNEVSSFYVESWS